MTMREELIGLLKRADENGGLLAYSVKQFFSKERTDEETERMLRDIASQMIDNPDMFSDVFGERASILLLNVVKPKV